MLPQTEIILQTLTHSFKQTKLQTQQSVETYISYKKPSRNPPIRKFYSAV